MKMKKFQAKLRGEKSVNSDFDLSHSGIIGDSLALQLLASQISTGARCDLPVLITGESGTGKELVARAIHRQSARAGMHFISINCGAFTETLLESELFGYRRGAFVSADRNKRGLFEVAHMGTIFLNEVGELFTGSQLKLLRVLERKAVQPVGAHKEIRIDVRVIAATNRNLAQESLIGRFREDLFYRLAVLMIRTSALRERSSDIPALVQDFVSQAEARLLSTRRHTFTPDAIDALSSYQWPGNIHQLRRVLENLVTRGRNGAVITAEAVYQALLTVNCLSDGILRNPYAFRENDSLDGFLDRTLLGLYSHLHTLTGNHSQIARLLRTDRIALYQRLKRARQRVQNDGK